MKASGRAPALKLTRRGKVVVAVLVGLGFSAFLFHDGILFIAFAIVSILFLSELFWTGVVVSKPNRFFVLRPKNGEGRVVSYVPFGEAVKSDYVFTMRARGARLSLSVPVRRAPGLSVKPTEFGRGNRSGDVVFTFCSPFAGVYPIEGLEASVLGPLELFETGVELKVGLEYRVYPKIYDVAIIASKILGKSGIGEIPTKFRGIGTEFYDSRLYQPGDDAKKINWKASARTGKLVVNDRVKEVGARYFLILNAATSSYFDRDRLASTFLQISNTLATLGANFGFLVYDNVSSFRKKKDIDAPLATLKSAREVAVGLTEISGVNPYPELFVAPMPSQRIQSTKDQLSKAGLASLAEFEGVSQHQVLLGLKRDPVFRAVFDIVRQNPSEPPDVIYVGDTDALSFSIATIIEASAELKRGYGAEFVAVDPTMPWVLAEDEAWAVALYEKRVRNLGILRNANVEYRVGGPLKIAEELFA